MANKTIYKVVNYLIAGVWLANGLLCKVLNLVPRHKKIVAEILGNNHAEIFTKLIGVSEILMAVWILTGYKSRINVVAQILIIALMNTLEFILAPHLLLWGYGNAAFAFVFILLIYYNEFFIGKEITEQK